MRFSSTIFIFGFLLVFTLSCNKEDDPAALDTPTNYQSVFQDSEWVGVMVSINSRWNKPCVVNIHDESNLTIYAIHVFNIENQWVLLDSIKGDISNISVVSDSIISMEVYFPQINESQVIKIENNQDLINNITPDASFPNRFAMNLARYTDHNTSIVGTQWSGNLIATPGPAQGLYEYPDLSAIAFQESQTFYIRNGLEATIESPQIGEFMVAKSPYIRRGARVYMSGFNEINWEFHFYFGVLLPGGTEMLADTYTASRVPSVFDNIFWFGNPGVTPKIYKIN